MVGLISYFNGGFAVIAHKVIGKSYIGHGFPVLPWERITQPGYASEYIIGIGRNLRTYGILIVISRYMSISYSRFRQEIPSLPVTYNCLRAIILHLVF